MNLFLACLFGGWFGLHKFIEKKIGIGILYLITCGLFGIGWIIDCIIYGTKLFKNTTPQVAPAPSKQSPIVTPTITTPSKMKTHKVTGMSHYMTNIMTLASENPDYELSEKELIEDGLTNERIYQYNFYATKVELIPEPDNPHDPNAIKVLVDNMHVGYIKAGSCPHVLKLINENRIEKIDCDMGGGNYKYLEYDEYEEISELDKSNTPHYIHLKITEK